MSHSKLDISGRYLIKAFLIVGGFLALLYFGASLLMPLLVAAIMAIILDKPTQKLNKKGLPNWLSMTLSVTIMVVIVLALSWLISSQVNAIADDWPTIKEKAGEKVGGVSEWSKEQLKFDLKSYINDNQSLIKKAQSMVSVFLSSVLNLLSQSLLIFVYIILFMMQKQMFIKFFKKISSDPKVMALVLSESSKIVSNYLIGKGKIMVFLFVIYYLGFILGSVPYALFLAVFAALFSIVPYVGNIIGGGVAVLLSFLYAGATPALIVIGVISLAQLVENYILTPWIIGDEINLNPFITVFGIVLFSVLWGMVGAIISLPLIGVMKVVFEHVKGMEGYAYLLKKHND
ncbi:AI-2E family transporter [Mariniflexile ostreae]|uniref:AI-2E family transporter n=1 Tax=Mariniflexile ostreae TaxID=1520892 RepID=A0ABV5FC73_9FLAO